MSNTITELATKLIGDKKQWKTYRARVAALPESHRVAAQGFERYLMTTGPGESEAFMRMLDDLADLFDQGAADGVGVRAIVGDDPAAFAEEFKRNYGVDAWLRKEQQRLVAAIDDAEHVAGS